MYATKSLLAGSTLLAAAVGIFLTGCDNPAPRETAPPAPPAQQPQDEGEPGQPPEHRPKAFSTLPANYALEGTWRRQDREGWMTITALPKGRWRVRLLSSSPDEGPATSAPCGLIAEGVVKDGWLLAYIVPYDDDELGFGVGEEELAPGGRLSGKVLFIEFLEGRAAIYDGASWGICGHLADVTGDYWRASK